MTNKEIYDELRSIHAKIISDRLEVAGLARNSNTDTAFGEGVNDLANLMLKLLNKNE